MTTATKAKPSQTKKAQQQKEVSNYEKMVLDTNKTKNEFIKSTGGALKLILLLDNLEPRLKKVVKAIQKDDAMYKQLDSSVRRNKKGKTCVFYVLQAIYKGLDK